MSVALTLDRIDVAVQTADPDISQLTTKSLNGTGAFDVLMAATALHLQHEYENDRITRDEYATVYLGAMQAVLAQSVQFLLNHQSQEKIWAEIGLIRQKTVTELAQTDNLIAADLGFNDSTAVEGIVAEQILLAKEQVKEAAQRVLTATEEVVLTQQKVITELVQTETSTDGLPVDYGVWSGNASLDGLLVAQRDKILEEENLIIQKVVTEVANVSNALPDPGTYGKHGNTSITGLLEQAIAKGKGEALLLNQKAVSELSQTNPVIPANLGLVTSGYTIETELDEGTSTLPASIIGAQVALFNQQTKGFMRDAEQKLAKIFADMKQTQLAAEFAGTSMEDTYMLDHNIGEIQKQAAVGVGVTLTAP